MIPIRERKQWVLYIYVYMNICIYEYICVYMNICEYIYEYIYIVLYSILYLTDELSENVAASLNSTFF